jgi:glutamine synthetase
MDTRSTARRSPDGKGIEASDMLLMPDPDSARMDPFYDEPTLVISCDVLEPSTMKGYERDPRSIAKKAEAYLKSSGLGDTALLRPEPEFFVFDAVEWKIDMSGSFGARSIRKNRRGRRMPRLEGGKPRAPAAGEGRLLPSAAGRFACRTCAAPCASRSRSRASKWKSTTTRWPRPRQCEIGTKFNTLVKRADWLQILKYTVLNVARSYGKTATFMPKPVVGDNGSGMHVHQSVWKGGRTSSPATAMRVSRTSRCLLHRRGIIKHAKALNAITNPGTQLVQAPGARVRSADQPRVLRPQPLGLVAASRTSRAPRAAACEDAPSRSHREPVPRVRGDADGGPGRRAEQDPSGRAARQEPLRPRAGRSREGAASVRVARRGAGELDKDRGFLTRGGVFTDDMIDAYIGLKYEEVQKFRMTTHPIEFEMYYSA